MSLTTGTRFGPYELLSPLGKGGMGEVFLAEDTRLKRRVAIKFLPPESVADEQARKRLIREAQAAAKLDHPNICAIHEVSEHEGRNFIVMQYVGGETLGDRIRRNPCTLKEALDVAVQVADALGEAHSQGIIHRDIKPENIMMTARGQVKVLDFGLAKVLIDRPMLESQAETHSLLTESGVIVGTAPYMSPEQVKGEWLDARSDIFSFGAVVYEMISGHQAFAAKTVAETISAILVSEPPPLASYSIRAPAALERVLRKCLEKDRERRYRTMREVATELEATRREYERDGITVSTVDPAATTIRALAPARVTSLRAFLGSRLGLALAALVMLVTAVSVFALLFRSPPSTPTLTVKYVNSPAYDDYLRGKVNASSQNRDSNDNAIKLLEKAVIDDPTLAPAYAELARAYAIKANFFAPEAEKRKLNEDAKVAVERSLALDQALAEGHSVRGYVLWTSANLFPHEQAILSFKSAIALDPNLEEAHHQLGVIYMHIGLLDKAWDEIQKALSIDPSDTLARFRLGSINVCRGEYEEALRMLKTVPREADPAIVARATAVALFQLGRTQEASEVVEDYLKTYSTDEGGNVTSVKAMILAKAGKEREAEETIGHAIKIGKGFTHFHHTTYNIASAYALLNKPEEAIKWLRDTADGGFPCYTLFENDPNLNSLRRDDRFIAFMAELRQQWQRYQTSL